MEEGVVKPKPTPPPVFLQAVVLIGVAVGFIILIVGKKVYMVAMKIIKQLLHYQVGPVFVNCAPN